MASFEKVICTENIGLTTDTHSTVIAIVIKSSNALTGFVVSCMRRTDTIAINMRKYARSRAIVHRVHDNAHRPKNTMAP